MNNHVKRGLMIFRNDLRLNDSPTLSMLAQLCDELLCIRIISDSEQEANAFNLVSLGAHRYRFLLECLADLNTHLHEYEQSLVVLQGDPYTVIADLINKGHFSHVGMASDCGVYERELSVFVNKCCKQNHARFIDDSAECLYQQSDLPFSLENMPDVFSPFRRKVEKYTEPRKPIKIPNELPKQAAIPGELIPINVERALTSTTPNKVAQFIGGEKIAWQQVTYYFDKTHYIQRYKDTRNGLDGWDFSSKLSAWLAHGCISAASVADALANYEAREHQNESTYWLFFELLWRDFFHWQMYKQQHLMFVFSGIQNNFPNTLHDRETFEKWCAGETGYDIVDACMRQLNATGFMSNRGRQLVASCFVHELGQDWRYGAAYFEQQLIDYDVASNWGNWQYLAGVGSDPRGHRQFNLHKQTQMYDPQHHFINHWLQR
ncbi:DASH family cryptochrome [Alteromonas sp. ASW11-36]|uniref:Cryptochrome DASH n=1 Tax=Alteromonas arenosi TaxID=3055817 RepID=A0ABT7SXH2_9ALTE|nr:DASH family cryptochrome [Alteromonas sp. ASW11-36]MDM7860865.1 DASH family cryptochrome [Alteromonas sp. ASW11-36]